MTPLILMPALEETCPLVLKTEIRSKPTLEEDSLLVDVDFLDGVDVDIDVDVVLRELESSIGGPDEGIGGTAHCGVLEVTILHECINVRLPSHLVDIIINCKDIPICTFFPDSTG